MMITDWGNVMGCIRIFEALFWGPHSPTRKGAIKVGSQDLPRRGARKQPIRAQQAQLKGTAGPKQDSSWQGPGEQGRLEPAMYIFPPWQSAPTEPSCSLLYLVSSWSMPSRAEEGVALRVKLTPAGSMRGKHAPSRVLLDFCYPRRGSFMCLSV